MIHATGKLGKKLIFLLSILVLIVTLSFLIPPSTLPIIILMNIVISLFFFFLLKIFLTKRLAFTAALPVFLIVTLLSLKQLDPLNLILVISLSIAVGLLIK